MASFRLPGLIAASALFAVALPTLSLLPVPTQTALQLNAPGFASTTSATQTISYKPPKLKRAIRTAGTGARGECNNVSQVTVLPIVPDNHVGFTTAARPTFMAYVSGAKSAEFTLVKPGTREPVAVQTVQPDANGIVRVELPATTTELSPGKDYRWSMAVVCNPNRRSQDVFAQSWIQRIAVSGDVTKRLATADSDHVRARVYAEAGLWYDAIATLAKANALDPKNAALREDFIALLNQAKLTSIATKLLNVPQTASQTR